jgi:hypothetical protein
MSFEELDHSRSYGEEWFPTEAEVKNMDFQPFSDDKRKDGSISDYCAKTRNYRYKNHFWHDNLTPHYYKALNPKEPVTEEQKAVFERKQRVNKAHVEIEHAIYKLQEAVEDWGEYVDPQMLRTKSYQKIFLAAKSGFSE